MSAGSVISVGSLVVAALAVLCSAATVVYTSRAQAELETTRWLRDQKRDLYLESMHWLSEIETWFDDLTRFEIPIPEATVPPFDAHGAPTYGIAPASDVGDEGERPPMPPDLTEDFRNRLLLFAPTMVDRLENISGATMYWRVLYTRGELAADTLNPQDLDKMVETARRRLAQDVGSLERPAPRAWLKTSTRKSNPLARGPGASNSDAAATDDEDFSTARVRPTLPASP